MNRVLVTGGAGTIGAAVVRRLLRDPDWEVRVSDQRIAPQWMREGCEIHTGDLRDVNTARQATEGCSHVIHLAAIVGGIANFHKLPYTLTEVNAALYNAVVRAALDHEVERFVYVSGERPEDEPGIAHAVPDLIRKCLELPPDRPLPIFGDGTHTRTLTHVDDIADGIVTAMGSPNAVNEDFNVSASDELTVADFARIIWEECGRDPDAFALEHQPSFEVDVVRRWPSVEKAERLLGWRARIGVRDGIRQTVEWLRGVVGRPAH